MKVYVSILITAFLIGLMSAEPAAAQSETDADIPTADRQITAAVSAAPQPMREDAAVLGYDSSGELVTLRQGTNELTCLADAPGDDRFHVACYHNDLEPFMQRGRELSSDGHSTSEVREIRQQEIENGTLPLPQKPMSLYSLTGDSEAWDYETNTLLSARPLYVVYVPYATVESTGIAPSPVSEGAPWLMDPGKPWAHIMVGTGRTVGEAAEQ
ncbi:hypothetical protein [Rhodohalobacter sp. 8-1]|uniref:hypothetical protein n=1 Tax=Rhodohalobacter sp. 8-1 TaxID=3131972 RepID=UPI0030EDA38E